MVEEIEVWVCDKCKTIGVLGSLSNSICIECEEPMVIAKFVRQPTKRWEDTMHELTPDEFKNLIPKRITEKEWRSLSPTYCVVCQKFVLHWWDAWAHPQPAFSADRTIGGWYCSSHTSEELKSAQQKMRLTAFGVVLPRQPAKFFVFLHKLLARISGG